MTRRWKVLVALGEVTFLTFMLLMLFPRDDGLDWARKYGGKEDRAYFFNPFTGNVSYHVTFTFDTAPRTLKNEAWNRIAAQRRQDGVLIDEQTSDGWTLSVVENGHLVTCSKELSWIEPRCIRWTEQVTGAHGLRPFRMLGH